MKIMMYYVKNNINKWMINNHVNLISEGMYNWDSFYSVFILNFIIVYLFWMWIFVNLFWVYKPAYSKSFKSLFILSQWQCLIKILHFFGFIWEPLEKLPKVINLITFYTFI